MNRDLSHIRKDFTKESLDIQHLKDHPVEQFKIWLHDAIDQKIPEPTAMTLATASENGIPSARIVLLKKINEKDGFCFFSNYNSKKGTDLAQNHHAALNFFWPDLERQIRINGVVEKLAEQESEDYFKSRPTDSQLSAIASPQSQIIKDREQLEKWFQEAKSKKIKRPVHWGGYALYPTEIEFWQGRSGRLHDRIRFRLENNKWIKERLAP